MPYGHASMLLLGEGSEATEPYNKYANLFKYMLIDQFDQPIWSGTERFGKDISAKKIRDVSANLFLPKRPPPCFCRTVFCRNVRNSYQVPLGYVPTSSSALRPLGAAYIPILLSEVEQEQRLSGNGDREAIVVGAGLCNGEGERAYNACAPHYDISGS